MKYKGVDLTFENYASRLEGFSQDIKDEVRSAILDNTPIGDFIDVCRDDPFRLQQLRLAAKEFYPTWVFKVEDGANIYRIRNLSGVSVEMVETQVPAGLPREYIEELISWIEEGVVIPEDFNMRRVPKTILTPVSTAIKSGVDPNAIVKLSKGNEEAAGLYVQIAVKGLSLGKFEGKNLSNSCLGSVAELAGRPYIGSVVELLEPRSGSEEVEVLWGLAKSGFDFSLFEGDYYTSMQLSWIHQAFIEKFDVTKMLDTGLNNFELNEIYNTLAKDRSKRLSGRL